MDGMKNKKRGGGKGTFAIAQENLCGLGKRDEWCTSLSW
jgi:hypothetical protein